MAFLKEENLFDTLHRIEKDSRGYGAVYVDISKLKIRYQKNAFLNVLGCMLDNVVASVAGGAFLLKNDDVVLLGHDIDTKVAQNVFQVLKEAVVYEKDIENMQDYIKIYGFPIDFDEFRTLMYDIKNSQQNAIKKHPITASSLNKVIGTVEEAKVEDIVKRQPVYQFNEDGSRKLLFEEFFVALKDLATFMPATVDLEANRWLFSYVTQALDKKTMNSFFKSDIKNWPSGISINLNLKSVFTKDFVEFAKNFLKQGQQLHIEINLLDAFINFGLFQEAQKILQKGGHKVLIDGLTINILKMLNIDSIKPDEIKIFWDPQWEKDVNNEVVKDTISRMGVQNVILAKCDSKRALDWGKAYGIKNFQGPYVDDLQINAIMRACPDALNCTAEQCLKRKRLICGNIRKECLNLQMLEGE